MEGLKSKTRADTYSRIYIHIVFAVQGRENLIAPSWKSELHKYISGIITNKGHKSIIVNGMPDHLHVLIGLKPVMSVSDLVRDIKNNSSNFINKRNFVKRNFTWQEGYGAFSCSYSDVEKIYDYILNQEAHHRDITFKEEYIGYLEEDRVEDIE